MFLGREREGDKRVGSLGWKVKVVGRQEASMFLGGRKVGGGSVCVWWGRGSGETSQIHSHTGPPICSWSYDLHSPTNQNHWPILHLGEVEHPYMWYTN